MSDFRFSRRQVWRCDTALFTLVEADRRFRGAYCLHHQGDETSVYFNETTRRYIPQGCHVLTRRRQNLNLVLVASRATCCPADRRLVRRPVCPGPCSSWERHTVSVFEVRASDADAPVNLPASLHCQPFCFKERRLPDNARQTVLSWWPLFLSGRDHERVALLGAAVCVTLQCNGTGRLVPSILRVLPIITVLRAQGKDGRCWWKLTTDWLTRHHGRV
jgi:hypothetical protein